MSIGTEKNAGAKILVIDDSITVRMSLKDIFLQQGYDVLIAEEGNAGLQTLRQEDVDVVLLDLVMPERSGIDVLRQIKSDSCLRSIPVIMLTGVTDRNELVSCLDLGAEDFITKPWNEAELLARLRSMVRLKHALDATRASERWFHTISDAANDGIIVVDDSGAITFWNQAAEKIFGYTASEALNQDVHSLLSPGQYRDTQQAVFPSFAATGKGGAIGQTLELTALRKGGEEFPIEISISAVKNGDVWNAISVVRDISQRKQAEAERNRLQTQLVESSRKAGQAEIATSVLHNVGNVLNSVSVSAQLVTESVRKSHASDLTRATTLMEQNADQLAHFITADQRGRHLPNFLSQLARQLTDERDRETEELSELCRNIEHIKEIVSMQQSYATVSGVATLVSVVDLVEDALKTFNIGTTTEGIQLIRDYQDTPDITTDRHKVLQILINLLSNARHALAEVTSDPRALTVRIRVWNETTVRIEVEDNGVGIPEENLTRIFQHGFTTKKNGHGFGLHGSALAATELGGSLKAHSNGPGKGALFTLDLPLTAALKAERHPSDILV